MPLVLVFSSVIKAKSWLFSLQSETPTVLKLDTLNHFLIMFLTMNSLCLCNWNMLRYAET
jgi:hypothetical protein